MARLLAWYHQHRIVGLMLMLGFAAVTAVMMVSGDGGKSTAKPTLATWTPVLTATSTMTPTFTALPTAAQATQITHIVQSGETLTRIAQIYGVTTLALIEANPGITPDRLLVQQVINIPLSNKGDSQTPTSSAAPAAPDKNSLPTDETAMVDAGIIDTPVPTERPPLPLTLNGVPLDLLVSIDAETAQHMREIYLLGQSLGRNPHAFSKLGDSTIEPPFFLDRFDTGPYNLGEYAELQDVIDHFTVSGSFSRNSVAVRRGLGSWSVMDPMWAYHPSCQGGESLIACEIRVHNPSMMFIRMGANDAGVPDAFDRNLREIVEYMLEQGVIPLLGTKADRREGPENTNNQIIRQISVDYHVPLWDYDLVAGTLPGRGLGADAVHMTTFFPHDYTQSLAFERGYGVHNLLALIMLDRAWHVVWEDA